MAGMYLVQGQRGVRHALWMRPSERWWRQFSQSHFLPPQREQAGKLQS